MTYPPVHPTVRQIRRLDGNRIEVWFWSEPEPIVYRERSITEVSALELRRREGREPESLDTHVGRGNVSTESSLLDVDFAVSG